jgi:hypothetical protein
VRNVVSANDREASGLAQLARGRPSNAEMIAETKWDDHAALSCAAYKQCRRRMIFHSSAQIGERESRVLPAAGFFGNWSHHPNGMILLVAALIDHVSWNF